jgi:glutamate-1-semialdehyde 2,1-aminomutase
VYQAGTLSGNPVSVAAGLATLRHLRDHDPYPQLAERTADFVGALADRAAAHGIALATPHEGSLYSLFFRDGAPTNFAEVQQADAERFNRVFRRLLAGGVYVAPSAFEAGFVSTAHDEGVLEEALAVFDAAFAAEAG